MPKLVLGGTERAIVSAVLVEDSKGDPAERSNRILFSDAPLDKFPCFSSAGRWELPSKDNVIISIGTRSPLSASLRASTAKEDAWLYGWEMDGTARPESATINLEVSLSEVDREARTATGIVSFRSQGVELVGQFDALLCPTRMITREKAEPIHGVDWTMEPVEADKLPSAPARAFLLDGYEIAHANARPWGDGRWVLNFFRDKPADECDTRPAGRSRSRVAGKLVSDKLEGARNDTFTLFVPEATISAGQTLATRVTQQEKSKLASGSATYFEPDGDRSSTYSQYFNAAVAVDSVDKADKTVKGRVYLALPYDPKPLLVGGFSARICPPL